MRRCMFVLLEIYSTDAYDENNRRYVGETAGNPNEMRCVCWKRPNSPLRKMTAHTSTMPSWRYVVDAVSIETGESSVVVVEKHTDSVGTVSNLGMAGVVVLTLEVIGVAACIIEDVVIILVVGVAGVNAASCS